MIIVISAAAARVELANTQVDYQTQPGLGTYKDKGGAGEPEVLFAPPEAPFGQKPKRRRRRYAPNVPPRGIDKSQERQP